MFAKVKCHAGLYSRFCSFGFCWQGFTTTGHMEMEGKSVKVGNASFMVQVARVAVELVLREVLWNTAKGRFRDNISTRILLLLTIFLLCYFNTVSVI